MTFETIIDDLRKSADAIDFAPPVAYVYNPLGYARAPHLAYWKRYARGEKEALFVGMNPGPWGMAQTGVPFGAVDLVRDWLGVTGQVGRPPRLHEKRPVEGFACTRNEASGRRLWGWAMARFSTPERFFERFFVANYCPLLFLDAEGKNLTPDKIAAADRPRIQEPCDEALRRTVALLRPRLVVGIGAWAEARAREALDGVDVAVGRVTHPSPANPKANRGWAKIVEAELADLGVTLP